MPLRCFIAIEIPEKIRGAIVSAIDGLKKSGADVKWVSPENIHITLQFLGDTVETHIPLVKEALNKILLTYSPFYIKITGVGCFPDTRRPRVIWVGTEESQPVINLHRDIAKGMAGLGYREEERNFTPHLTSAIWVWIAWASVSITPPSWVRRFPILKIGPKCFTTIPGWSLPLGISGMLLFERT